MDLEHSSNEEFTLTLKPPDHETSSRVVCYLSNGSSIKIAGLNAAEVGRANHRILDRTIVPRRWEEKAQIFGWEKLVKQTQTRSQIDIARHNQEQVSLISYCEFNQAGDNSDNRLLLYPKTDASNVRRTSLVFFLK
jgi:hypothetical protein